MKQNSLPVRHTYDVLGIGFGPSNISLAIALEESQTPLSVKFIEAADTPNWQPNMLLDGSDIQNNPLRDLVTPRNPKSHYTFVNYLKCENRLFDYLNLGIAYPLRKEYARYVRWVARFFDKQVSYSTRALRVSHSPDGMHWLVETNQGVFAARALIVGSGRSFNIPDVFKGALGKRVFHLTEYLDRLSTLADEIESIAVIGASQSAVELNADLMARFPNLKIHAIHRSFSMQQKDQSPFSDHVYFPEFVEYFFKVDESARQDLQRQLRRTNYSSADIEALDKLYMSIYEERLDGRNRFHLYNNTLIDQVTAVDNSVYLSIRERYLGTITKLNVDAVVLATGFLDLGIGEGKEPYPPLLADIADDFKRQQDGTLVIQQDYRVPTFSGLPVYLNGLCESSHGLGDAGSFSLLSLRSTEILKSLGVTCPDMTIQALPSLAAAVPN